MIGTTFASLVRKYTGTDTTTLPDADLLLFANVEKDDLAEFIADQCGEDFFQLTYKRDLEVDKREYSLPRQLMLHTKRVSAMLDGENYMLLDEFDMNQVRKPLVTENDIMAAFQGKKPAFDIIDIGIKIYSDTAISAVTDGIMVDAIIYPEDITAPNLAAAGDLSIASATDKARLPKAAHRVWAVRTSIAYKQSRPKAIPLNEVEKQLVNLEARMLDNLKGRNLDRSYVPSAPVDNGEGY